MPSATAPWRSLHSLSHWSPAPGAVREARWQTQIGCDLSLDYCRGSSLISINLTSLSVTVITSGLSSLFYFLALRSLPSLCMNVCKRSAKMFFTPTAKSQWCLTYLCFQTQTQQNYSFRTFFILMYYLFFRCAPFTFALIDCETTPCASMIEANMIMAALYKQHSRMQWWLIFNKVLQSPLYYR